MLIPLLGTSGTEESGFHWNIPHCILFMSRLSHLEMMQFSEGWKAFLGINLWGPGTTFCPFGSWKFPIWHQTWMVPCRKYQDIYKKTTKYFNFNLPRAIQVYKIPTKHPVEHYKNKRTRKSKQHTRVMRTGGGRSNQEHTVSIPRFPWFPPQAGVRY